MKMKDGAPKGRPTKYQEYLRKNLAFKRTIYTMLMEQAIVALKNEKHQIGRKLCEEARIWEERVEKTEKYYNTLMTGGPITDLEKLNKEAIEDGNRKSIFDDIDFSEDGIELDREDIREAVFDDELEEMEERKITKKKLKSRQKYSQKETKRTCDQEKKNEEGG